MMQKLLVIIKYFHVIFFLGLQLTGLSTEGQELNVVKSYKEYRKKVKADSLHEMVEIQRRLPELVYDLRYATKNNFTGERLYTKAGL